MGYYFAMKRSVYFAKFQTSEPLNHLPRALDTLRRMGFDLCRVSREVTGPATSIINVTYEPKGDLTPSNLIERIRQMQGVENLESGRTLEQVY